MEVNVLRAMTPDEVRAKLGAFTASYVTDWEGWLKAGQPDRVARFLIWVNGRKGTVEDFIVKSAMFQDEVAMVATNQAYGLGTMIGQWPAQILAACTEPKEGYITATIDLGKVRMARQNSRNLRQRRPEAYGEIVRPIGADEEPGL